MNRLNATGQEASVPAALRGARVARWAASAVGAVSTALLLKVTTPEVVIGASGAE